MGEEGRESQGEASSGEGQGHVFELFWRRPCANCGTLAVHGKGVGLTSLTAAVYRVLQFLGELFAQEICDCQQVQQIPLGKKIGCQFFDVPYFVNSRFECLFLAGRRDLGSSVRPPSMPVWWSSSLGCLFFD